LEKAQALASKIDDFVRDYSSNIMSKLISIASFQQQESFEIQLKTRFNEPNRINKLLDHPDVQIVKHTHYRQYDTYFLFENADGSRLRYREDDTIGDTDEVKAVRTRLTYTLPTKEREFDKAVLLSHSQLYAPADRPLRFYREYFKSSEEREIHKDRLRWHILYKGVLFYINFDTMLHPDAKHKYLEIKSRTWSLKDAEYKASLASEILSDILEIDTSERVAAEYVDMAANSSTPTS
jgi:hypothetical protein